jgi:hypothetical protein
VATDATGTPTSLGIPKFDPTNDAPSGLGGNAQMDAIDALLAQTPRSGSIAGIAVGSVPVWNGTAWVKPSGTPDGTKFLRDDGSWATASAAPGYGTSLPGSPTDGQEYILVDSTTAPTYAWRLRYNAGSASTYKWEFIGGSPAVVGVAASQGTASTSYVDLATAGPSFTLPKAGDYDIEFGAASTSASATMNTFVGLHINGVLWQETLSLGPFGGAASIPSHGMMLLRPTGLTATHVVKLMYKVSAGTGTWAGRILKVTPVRVS